MEAKTEPERPGHPAIMNITNGNTTTASAYFPLPGGATYYQTGTANGSGYFWHKDWLGTVRLASSLGSRAYFFDRAFAPFAQMYDNFGNTAGLNFTGDTQDSFIGLFDTPNRELSSAQGRWISPDPAGLRAVDLSNPQTWNRYAYVANNPNLYIDPLGLWRFPCSNPGGEGCYGDPVGSNTGTGFGSWSDFILFAGYGVQCTFGDCVPLTIDGAKDVFLLFGAPDGGRNSCAGPNPPSPCAAAKNPSQPCGKGWGVGWTGGASGEIGGGDALAAAGTGSIGGGLFHSSGSGVFSGYSLGGFASGGAAGGITSLKGTPSQDMVSPAAGGVYGGVGQGFFISNAGSAGALSDHFATYTVDTPVISVQYSTGGGIWSLSVTFGRGALVGGSMMTTNTVTKGTAKCD